MRVRLIVPALLAVVVVAVAGCGSATYGSAAGKTAGKPAAEPSAGDAVESAAGKPVTVPESLRFTGTTLDGKAFDGASMAGHPVVLWFWAPWCAICAGEAATVSDAAAKYKGSVDFLGVAGMGQEKEEHSFVSDMDVAGITHLSDNAGVVWKRFGITQQSLYVLIDRTGKVVTKGYLDDLQFNERVAKLAAA
jgi:thiol-disulfide isomerase/thioredoxin